MNGLPEARTSIKTYALSLKRVKREKCNKIKNSTPSQEWQERGVKS